MGRRREVTTTGRDLNALAYEQLLHPLLTQSIRLLL